MTDVDAAMEGIPSISDMGDCTRQEENDLEVGATKQSLAPHKNESSLNRGSPGTSGSEDHQTDPDMINPWSKCGLLGDSELGPHDDLDAEVDISPRMTQTVSLIGMETDTNVVHDQSGVRGERSTAAVESTGCSETLIETFKYQKPISPPASKIEIALEEENLAKVGNPKTADSEDEKARTMSPEQKEISQSNHGMDYSPDSVAPPYSTDAAVNPEDPNPSPRFQVEHKLTKADHLQPVVTNNDEPFEGWKLDSPVHLTEVESSHGAGGDLGVDNFSECVPSSIPTVAVEVALAKPHSSSRRACMEKTLTNADHLQPTTTHNGKPLENQGETKDVGNSNSSQGARGDSGMDDSSECTTLSNPTDAVAVALAKLRSSSRRAWMERSLTNADGLLPPGTNNAKPVQYQGQAEDVGNNHSSQGVRGDLRVDNSSESAQPFNPPMAAVAASAKHSTLSTREKNLSYHVHFKLASPCDNAKPLEYKDQTGDVGNNHISHGAQGDVWVGDSSESVPPFDPPVVAVVAPTKHSTLSRREEKPSNADHLQPAGTHTAQPPEYQGQPEDLRNNNWHDAWAEDSFEHVSPLNPTAAVAAPKHSNPSRREKKLTTANPLQTASMDNGKPFEGQGQSEYFGHYNSLHDVKEDLGVDDFSECVAVAGAPAKHCSSQVEKKLSSADHLQPGSTNNAKAVGYQGQTVGVGHNDSLHGAQGELGAFNTSEPVPEYYPTDSVAPVVHAKSSRQAQVEKKPTNANHLQPSGTYNTKPLENQGQGLHSLTEGFGDYNSSHAAQLDLGVDDSSNCAPPMFSVSHKSANPSRGPQTEQKTTSAYQLAGSNKHPEDQGQGLQRDHRREGVGHMTSSYSMQGDITGIPSRSMSTSPQNFQQPFVVGATSGVYQINQAGYSRTSLLEHVQPQRPHSGTKVSKLGPYDGGRRLVSITQNLLQDSKPVDTEARVREWHHLCREAWREKEGLEREVESCNTKMWKMEHQIQDLTSKLKQAQENTALLNKQISKYEQQHAQEIHRSGSYLDDSKAATPALLVSALNGVRDASNNFAKAFKAQVDSSPSILQASMKQHLSQHVGQVSRNGHIKFQYQAYICRVLFEGFDHRNFGVFESTVGLPVATAEHCFWQYQMHDFKKSDTVERLFRRDPEINNFLHEYCFKKFSLILNRQLEEQLFDGKCEQNDIIDKYEHPCNSRFYRSYCKLAVSIWLVHRLAFSFNQPAKLFRPPPGMPFNTSNMQSVVPLDPLASDDEEVQLKVGFCVIPGMKVGNSIVPSEVYVFGQ